MGIQNLVVLYVQALLAGGGGRFKVLGLVTSVGRVCFLLQIAR